MSEVPKNIAQVFKNPYKASCDVFSCFQPAKWFIGRRDGPYNLCLNLCDKCLNDIISTIPAEMIQQNPPEGTVLVSAEYLEYLEGIERQRIDFAATKEGEPKTFCESKQGEFMCDYPGCGRTFASKNALIAHQRVHKKEGTND